MTFDRQGDPVHFVTPTAPRYQLYVLRAVDQRSNLLRVGTVLEAAALDKYTFIRDAHLQRRRAEIFEIDPVDIPSDTATDPAAAPAARQPTAPAAR